MMQRRKAAMRTITSLLFFVIATWFSTYPKMTARADEPTVTFDVIKPLNHLAANVIKGSDGVLYGTTSSGGASYRGSVFKINRDGSGYTVLKNFNDADGSQVLAPVLEGLDGALYGTTYAGGSGGKGTVFKVNKDGSGFTVLKNFSTSATADGLSPAAGLVQDGDGALYGTTQHGGSGARGTIFTIEHQRHRLRRATAANWLRWDLPHCRARAGEQRDTLRNHAEWRRYRNGLGHDLSDEHGRQRFRQAEDVLLAK